MKSERKRLTDRLDGLCRESIRARDKNLCQKCGKVIYGHDSHPSHVIAKGSGASWRRFDLLNIKLMCFYHHRWWHLNPTESGKWFAEKFPQREAYLEKYRYGKNAKISTIEMKQLQEEYKEKLK